MKTTTMFRNIANPRRTTLAHLTDAEELGTEAAEHTVELLGPDRQPRRTVLMTAPEQGVPA